MRFFVFVLFILLTFQTARAQQSSRQDLIRDSQRRQALQASAKSWFERNVLRGIKSSLTSLDGYGVSVREPKVVLPPDLGGPKNHVHVILEARFSGWIERGYRYDRRFPGFPEYGPVNCRFQQKLWADVDPRNGRPTRITPGQSAQLMFGCASMDYDWPGPTPRDPFTSF